MDVSGVHGDDDVMDRIDVDIATASLDDVSKILPVFTWKSVFPNGHPPINSANSVFMFTMMIVRIYSA